MRTIENSFEDNVDETIPEIPKEDLEALRYIYFSIGNHEATSLESAQELYKKINAVKEDLIPNKNTEKLWKTLERSRGLR